ncbi:hypothetical protein P9D43_03530 [Neobacillus niacini]|uniref:hypothetical protein n=1 Tax=Neobacillus niacini TaxID=86668 RepID=UPI0007AC099A|nr:hypothetical protein [Neobacillus niacini]MEC1521108.1 hypothetical protein [Neobacillus niacini]
MPKGSQETKSHTTTNNNKNTVHVNNNFNLTINLGDSLNLLALIGGIYLIRTLSKKRNQKQQQEKM